MARSTSSLSKNFDQERSSEVSQSHTSTKQPVTIAVDTSSRFHNVPLSAAAILSPAKSEYAIFLQSQSPKIRDGKEIIETRKQRLLEVMTKNWSGPQESSMAASVLFAPATSPSKDKAHAKAANVAGSEGCTIKMGDSRVFSGSNL